jgi:eukaryotic-like serine/threonine-protein kinase
MSTNPIRIDKYELQELLKRDGMAEVWKAFDTQSHRYVAIKFLHANLQADPDFVARFQREMPAIAALHHPNIVQYYDYTTLQPSGPGTITASLVMNYVDGGTLADYIETTARQGKFPPVADIVRHFTTIGAALDYAHKQGIVHGQLKPTNILLDRRNLSRSATGEPVVTDFGIVKLLGNSAGPTANTGAWRSGVPLYTAPEQITGSPADERSDIYSLGIMLYEICTGTPPFPGNNPAAVMMQHINTVPTLPVLINPTLPSALTPIIMRSIAKDPWARFPTVAAMMEALEQVVGPGAKEDATVSMSSNASLPDQANKSMNMPTILTRSGPPSAPGISGVSYSPVPQPAQTPGGGSFPGISSPYASMSSQPYPAIQTGGPAQGLPATSYAQPPLMPPTPARRPARRRLWAILAGLLILVLLGSGLGAYFIFFAKGAAPPPAPSTSSIAGHAYFVSSGLLSTNVNSSLGITDQLQIKLTNVTPPPLGKGYYAWLLTEKSLPWHPVPLGQLTVNNGVIDFSYQGDQQHSNLLATDNRFIITEEDAGSPPLNPSLNAGALLYYAEFSQIPDPTNPKHYSLYDHLRHLLSDDPTIKAAGLTGGLDIWLYRNAQSILEWAGSARDLQQSGNVALIRRQLARIIDYLDGTYYNQHDLPNVPLLVDPTIAKLGLLTFDAAAQVHNPGYLYHIGTHLRDIAALPQADAQQKALASQISQAINAVNSRYQTVRADILQLYAMSDAQLLGSQGRPLLDEVATLANDAFVGQIDAQGHVIAGVVQIHYSIQRLATFDIKACTGSTACPSLA